MNIAGVVIPANLLAVCILTLGAVVALLLVSALSNRAGAAAIVGLPFALVAGAVGLTSPGVGGLAVVGLCLVAALALLLLPSLMSDAQESAQVAEASALLLLGTAGGIALATAGDLLAMVVGMETLALSAVVLVALGRGERALEAAFKYFVLGAISLSGLLLGLALIYLGTGSFAFPTVTQVAASHFVLAGVVLVTLGFAFELAVFPFHWGGLDAYTAAAPGLAGYVMSASKLAAAFALGRLALAAGPSAGQVLVWIGCLTIIWGTFGALAQNNLRRLLAYSAVTHAGFIALAAGSGANGPVTAAFYAAVYGTMAMLVFAALAGRGDSLLPLTDFRPGQTTFGRGRAAALALGLLSLSGIPPTPGFWAKLAVLVVAWQADGWLPTLIAVAGGVFSVLYYLKPLPDLFAAMRAAPAAAPTPATARSAPAFGVWVAALFVVALGLFPGLAWTLARTLPGSS